MTAVRASAFHARTSAVNLTNRWTCVNGVTLPLEYRDACDEALCAHTRVGVFDLSGRWQLAIDGPRAVEFLQALLTRDVDHLAAGTATKALWLTDGGGVRGAGAIARLGRESFWLVSYAPDAAWMARAARLFGVSIREVSAVRSGLAIVGPYAAATLAGAGMGAGLELLGVRKEVWRGMDIALSRLGELGGFEVWCHPDDALLLWDRIWEAGVPFGIATVGTLATDILDVECGVPRPGRDYMPASEADAKEPLPFAFGLDSLVDPDHLAFNGRRPLLREPGSRRLKGVEIRAQSPAAFASLLAADGMRVGRTLSSVWSPSLRRAIALAQIDESAARPGTTLSLTLPSNLECSEPRSVEAQVSDLPFLAFSDSLSQ